MALSQNKQTLLRLTEYVWTASYLLDCGRRSGKEKTAVNKIMRVQTRFHHSVQTSTATSAAEVTVELVCKRNSPRQLTGGEHKEDKNTKCNMWGSKEHMLYDQAVRSKNQLEQDPNPGEEYMQQHWHMQKIKAEVPVLLVYSQFSTEKNMKS